MRTSKLKTKNSIFKVRTYTVDTYSDNILGKGAYGIVHRATDSNDTKVAAETIYGKITSENSNTRCE